MTDEPAEDPSLRAETENSLRQLAELVGQLERSGRAVPEHVKTLLNINPGACTPADLGSLKAQLDGAGREVGGEVLQAQLGGALAALADIELADEAELAVESGLDRPDAPRPPVKKHGMPLPPLPLKKS